MIIGRVLGTSMPYTEHDESAFSVILSLVQTAGGFSLSQVCAVTGLEGSTVQNWVKRGWVPKPINKKYYANQLVRILLIASLRDGLQIEQIVSLIIRCCSSCEQEISLYNTLCTVADRIDPKDGISVEHIEEELRTQGYIAPKSMIALLYAYFAGSIRRGSDAYVIDALT